MANFAVTDHVTDAGTLETVMAALETYVETIDDSKTIRLIDVKRVGGGYPGKWQGIVLHDA